MDRLAIASCWYFVVALTTISAKVTYLRQAFPRAGADLQLDPMMFGSDLWQVALLAAVVYFLGAPRLLASFCALVFACTHVSFTEVGGFVTRESLSTVWHWFTQNPEQLREQALVIATYALGSAVFVYIAGLRFNAVWLPPLMIVAGWCGAMFALPSFAAKGYWASVLEAALDHGVDPSRMAAPSWEALTTQYARIAALGDATRVEPPVKRRHIVVVGLETAPRAFYALDTPTFKRMKQHAITSDHHYTTSPYTRLANFSILSGIYAPSFGTPVKFGPITGGWASVLKRNGYQTTYIDSWVLDWLPHSGERAQAEALGFDTVIDSQIKRDDGVWDVLLEAEKVAFDHAAARIAAADDAGKKAAIFIGTMLGHGPWVEGEATIKKVEAALDPLFQRFLDKDVAVLIVGDHGLRLADEFKSVGRQPEHSDIAFNVPFLLYVPGIAPRQLDHVTSHVDLAPTILDLLGVKDAPFTHGSSVFEPRQRIVFLPNSKLSPLDGFIRNGKYETRHALTGKATAQDANGLLTSFDEHCTAVAARMLQDATEPVRSNLRQP